MSDSKSELEALRAELAGLRAELRQVATHSAKTAHEAHQVASEVKGRFEGIYGAPPSPETAIGYREPDAERQAQQRAELEAHVLRLAEEREQGERERAVLRETVASQIANRRQAEDESRRRRELCATPEARMHALRGIYGGEK